jgi:hypothetical protein
MEIVTCYDDLTHGQTKALVSKMGGVEIALAFLRGDYKLMSIATEKNQQLCRFFTNSPSLIVHEKFRFRILPYHSDTATTEITENISHDLTRDDDCVDRMIISQHLGGLEMTKSQSFTLNQVSMYLMGQLDGQDDGPLLINDTANIFYCLGENEELFAVRLRFRKSAWNVGGWKLGEYGSWNVGTRIFTNNHSI